MRKHALWLTLVLLAALIAPLAAPAAAAELQRSTVTAPVAGGPDVSDVRVGTPTLFETFRQDNGKWQLGPSSSGDRSIADGMLIIDVADENKLVWSIYDGSPDEFADFYVEVDVAYLSGPMESSFGIAFRMEDSDNSYLFEITPTGKYQFSELLNNEWETIVAWTASNALNKGQSSENSLGVLAVGDWIVLLANDRELKRIRNDTFSVGWIGLAASAYDKVGTEVGFDNLRLWQASTTQNNGGSSGSGGSSSGNASVTNDTLNVRSGPSTGYPAVAVLRRGDGVQMIGRTADSQWVKISLAGKPQAWVAARYLSPNVRVQDLPVDSTSAPPAGASQSSCGNEAYLVIENHIGKYITVQVATLNFRVDGKVGDVPGRYYVTLKGTGHYNMAAQLPNEGSTNFDLYVEATPDRCANRTDCLALCQTRIMPFALEN